MRLRACAVAAAALGAVLDFVPHLGPLFTPDKGPAAAQAEFLGQMRFAMHGS